MERTPARAWLVWGVAVAAYTIAVLQRTSLGVSGLDAAQRFGISAALLATFAVVQLLVYAAMQIPVGAMVDRVGPRAMVVAGALLMALGQVALALAESFPAAILARVLVGAGDAMTFISVLRLVASWFAPRQVPVLTQVTGLVGQGGQILSAIPLVAILHTAGWTPAFLSAASFSVLAAVLTLVVVRDTPDGTRSADESPSWAKIRHDLVSAWQHPGTRLGLWTHFTTQFSGTVFVMLWGYPFLTSGEGLTRQEAGALFTVMVLSGMAAGPVIGVLVSRHPLRRSWLVLGIILSAMGVWTVVLALPEPAPGWLLLVLVLVLSVSGPGSMIAFDYARTFNPPNRFGTATGIVNVGGFVAALVTILLVGLVLDLVGQGETYTLSGFRVALSVQYLFWVVGLVGFLRARRRVRARMASEGTHVPPLREALRRRRAARS
ncbi:MAG: MFS transporter [Actinomycetales bacterium]|nr:MFS transporter [Actinomycetales bacterium]